MIVVERLRTVFPNGHVALEDVSITVQSGEVVCVVGRSGAGKSTHLRCLNGMLDATAGRVTVENVEITGASEAEQPALRRRIGFVYQEFNLVERLSVMKNVLAGRLGHRDPISSSLHWFDTHDREIALRSLERVNLAHKAHQRADSLSGGEKQRVAIARALTQEPVAVLADEPVASLDPELAWSVMSDLKRTATESGIVTLVNIHDVNLARVFADRIVGIADGTVVFDGPPTALDETAMVRIYQGSAAAFALSDQAGYANRAGAEETLTLAEREAVEAAEGLP